MDSYLFSPFDISWAKLSFAWEPLNHWLFDVDFGWVEFCPLLPLEGVGGEVDVQPKSDLDLGCV